MQNRRDALAQLRTNLAEISEIKTAIRTYLSEFDIIQYSMAEVPLVAVVEPEENTDDESTSQRSMMTLNLQLLVYFLHWGIIPNSDYETLVKKIRDKIGGDFDLSGKATKCRVTGVSILLGIMPLYNFTISVEIKYYLNETAV